MNVSSKARGVFGLIKRNPEASVDELSTISGWSDDNKHIGYSPKAIRAFARELLRAGWIKDTPPEHDEKVSGAYKERASRVTRAESSPSASGRVAPLPSVAPPSTRFGSPEEDTPRGTFEVEDPQRRLLIAFRYLKSVERHLKPGYERELFGVVKHRLENDLKIEPGRRAAFLELADKLRYELDAWERDNPEYRELTPEQKAFAEGEARERHRRLFEQEMEELRKMAGERRQ